MTVAYLDCFSGIAGDMVLGAFIDAGLPVEHLASALKKIGLGGYRLDVRRGRFDGVRGVNFGVAVSKDSAVSSYREIAALIKKSSLSKNVRRTALDIFSRLASAEARVHRRKKSGVHFHEVGATDSIVDVAGCAIALEYFGFDRIYCSPLPFSRGYVECAHGRLPVPAPAAMELLKGVPLERSDIFGEIVTPTGAAIAASISDGFCSMPLRRIDRIGYGFGDRRTPGVVNALRLLIGDGKRLCAVEASIDDMNPEFYPHVIETLLKSGAVDAGVIPMIMKKGRPGAVLHVLCEEDDRKRIIGAIMRETTTFGVRFYPVERTVAEREFRKVRTKWGTVRVKIAKFDNAVTTAAPEYADCRALASAKNVPIKDIYRAAILKCGI